MEYGKPEIVASVEAVSAIQGSKGGSPNDVPDTNPFKTTNAYEADE
jgi:hypothetical protein